MDCDLEPYQDVEERRINRALTQFKETYSSADLLAMMFGTQEAQKAERLRFAENM